MKHVRSLIVTVILGVSLSAQAGEATGVLLKKLTTPTKKLSLTTDFQVIDEINKISIPGIKARTQYGRFHLGVKYNFSEISDLLIDVPFGFLYSTTDYVGVQARKVEVVNWLVDRVKLGIDAKLFRETLLGEISWSGRFFAPTLYGDLPRGSRFYNHMAFSLGLKNLYRHPRFPLYALGSFSYIKKFEAKYFEEEVKYGDEYAASVGVGYSIHSLLHPSVSFQYSYVGPREKRILAKLVEKTKSGAHAFHVVPMLSIPVSNSLSFQGISRILIQRTKVDNKGTSSKMWGNFEDEGELSVTLGARLKLL